MDILLWLVWKSWEIKSTVDLIRREILDDGIEELKYVVDTRLCKSYSDYEHRMWL